MENLILLSISLDIEVITTKEFYQLAGETKKSNPEKYEIFDKNLKKPEKEGQESVSSSSQISSENNEEIFSIYFKDMNKIYNPMEMRFEKFDRDCLKVKNAVVFHEKENKSSGYCENCKMDFVNYDKVNFF
jgi:hypothetical protein